MQNNVKKWTVTLGAFILFAGLGWCWTLSVGATEPASCATVEECEQMLEELESSLSDNQSDKHTLEAEQQDLQAQRSLLQKEITTLEESRALVKAEQAEVVEKIKLQQIEVAEIEIEIEGMRERVYALMRLDQRESYHNVLLTFISENMDLSSATRQLRQYLYFNNMNKELVEQLKDALTRQETILLALKDDQVLLETQQETLKMQEEAVASKLSQLRQLEAQIQSQLQKLEDARVETAEIMALVEEQKNTIIASANETFMIPMESGYVTCEFGCYVDRNGIPHNGIDLGNYGNTSTRILAAASGTVIRSGHHTGYGYHVIISHNLNGNVFTTVYGHMKTNPYVSVGQAVEKGQTLGTMGNTGNSTGPHLHFELYEGYYNWPHSVNPRDYISFPAAW